MALKAAEVIVQSFVPKHQVGLVHIKFLSVIDFHQSAQASRPEDIMWAVGWTIKNRNPIFEHSKWNEFMKSIRPPKSNEMSLIEFLMIIESDLNDYSIIYATLMECVRNGKYSAVIIFDVPI